MCQNSKDNTESHEKVSESRKLTPLTKRKLIIENGMESCIKIITSDFGCGENTETIEEIQN